MSHHIFISSPKQYGAFLVIISINIEIYESLTHVTTTTTKTKTTTKSTTAKTTTTVDTTG